MTMFQPIKSIRVVYLGGKIKTTTVQTPAAPVATIVPPEVPQVNDDSNRVFQANGIPALPGNGGTGNVVRPEDITENICIREGCQKFAIVSPEWEDEYCSNECAVQHCKDVFAAFVRTNNGGQPLNGALIS